MIKPLALLYIDHVHALIDSCQNERAKAAKRDGSSLAQSCKPALALLKAVSLVYECSRSAQVLEVGGIAQLVERLILACG